MITIDLASSVERILAVDSSVEMIKKAKEKAANEKIRNIQWQVSDISNPEIFKKQYKIITSFNLLLYLKDIEEVLEKIYDNLPERGYFISVTDCLGEKKDLIYYLEVLATKIGIFPYMNYFSMNGLKEIIISKGFKVIFSENVFEKTANYYIVAQKTAD